MPHLLFFRRGAIIRTLIGDGVQAREGVRVHTAVMICRDIIRDRFHLREVFLFQRAALDDDQATGEPPAVMSQSS